MFFVWGQSLNLENKALRELIEYASSNGYQVCIQSFYAYIELNDDFLSVTFFETSGNEICILKNPKDRNVNPVRITIDCFKSLFCMRDNNEFR